MRVARKARPRLGAHPPAGRAKARPKGRTSLGTRYGQANFPHSEKGAKHQSVAAPSNGAHPPRSVSAAFPATTEARSASSALFRAKTWPRDL